MPRPTLHVTLPSTGPTLTSNTSASLSRSCSTLAPRTRMIPSTLGENGARTGELERCDLRAPIVVSPGRASVVGGRNGERIVSVVVVGVGAGDGGGEGGVMVVSSLMVKREIAGWTRTCHVEWTRMDRYDDRFILVSLDCLSDLTLTALRSHHQTRSSNDRPDLGFLRRRNGSFIVLGTSISFCSSPVFFFLLHSIYS